jgi:hypothetical protein
LFYFALSTFPLPPRFKRVIDEPGKTAGGWDHEQPLKFRLYDPLLKKEEVQSYRNRVSTNFLCFSLWPSLPQQSPFLPIFFPVSHARHWGSSGG